PKTFAEFAARQRRILNDAREQGVELAVLPEYLSLELGSTLPEALQLSLRSTLESLQIYQSAWCELYSTLAVELGMTIQAGTFLTATSHGMYRNRAWWFTADGRSGWQDKLQLTGFEKQAVA
ncbi:nitrilase, partial [Leclercia adecarboxylata]|nr:nitrilase [Leclercia adecarboxylata]